jgi:hypothetical protein
MEEAHNKSEVWNKKFVDGAYLWAKIGYLPWGNNLGFLESTVSRDSSPSAPISVRHLSLIR